MSNPTKEELEEFIDELIICEQTNFIDTLIDDSIIPRCDIHYNNINNSNSEWYCVNMDYCDFDFEELITLLCECNITHTHFKQHIWIGINGYFNEIYEKKNWMKLYKLIYED